MEYGVRSRGGGGVDNTALQDINTHIDIHVGLDVDGRL